VKKFFPRCNNFIKKPDIPYREEVFHMSDELTCAELEAKSLEELQAMLADDKLLPLDDETNTEYIIRITEVIAKKENKTARQREAERVAFWTEFLGRYGDKIPIRLEDITGKSGYRAGADSPQVRAEKRRHAPARRSLRSGFAAAVVLLGVTVSGLLAAYAFNVNILSVIHSFTDNVFRKDYVSPESAPSDSAPEMSASPDAPETGGLQSVLDEHGVKRPKAPSWLPEGYTLSSVEQKAFPDRNRISAVYLKGEQAVTLTVISFTGDPPEHVRDIEKDGADVELYSRNGIDHYIFTNLELTVATWIDGTSDCDIQGGISKDEVKAIINSMYLEDYQQ
jgi:hypothetical protein